MIKLSSQDNIFNKLFQDIDSAHLYEKKTGKIVNMIEIVSLWEKVGISQKRQKDGDKKSDGGNDTFLGKHFYVV